MLETHLAAGDGRFRGVRVRAAWHPDPAFAAPVDGPPADLLQQPGFLEGFAQLRPLGLRCDLWVSTPSFGPPPPWLEPSQNADRAEPSLAAAFAPLIIWLTGFRFLIGLGLGAEIVVGHGTPSEFKPPAIRGRPRTVVAL